MEASNRRQRPAEAAARLCELLTARPFTAHAVTTLLRSWNAAGVNIERVIRHYAASGSSPSLLLLAAAAGDHNALFSLSCAGGDILPGEDVYAALVEAPFANELCNTAGNLHDIDSRLSDTLSTLPTYRIFLPSALGPSRATVICTERRLVLSLMKLTRIDQWAMHYLQSLTSSIAAGVKATEDATAVVAAVSAGDEAATSQAVMQLLHSIRVAWKSHGEWEYDPLRVAAARFGLHAMLQVHSAAGTLRALVLHKKAKGLQRVAYSTRDMDVLAALTDAGLRLQDVSLVYEDVYASIIEVNSMWDASGAPVSDERLAVYMKRLYDIGLRVPTSEEPLDSGPSRTTIHCAEHDRIHCLRAMVEVIDPHATATGDHGRAALHYAGMGCSADCITYLIEAGSDVYARDAEGFTPMDLCITSNVTCVDRACVAAITAMTARMDDVRPLILSGVLVAQPAIEAGGSIYASVRRHDERIRRHIKLSHIQLQVIAAVRATPAGPLLVLTMRLREFVNPRMWLFRSEALDAHSVDGVYIPDQLRAGGDAEAATQVAVQVDAVMDLLPHMNDPHRTSYRTVLSVWQQYVQPRVIPGISLTVMSWAYMRRLHALKHRRDVSVEG